MILRVCLCIPCYNNPTTITQVAIDALAQTAFSVLVVDDGSGTRVSELLSLNEEVSKALTSGRLRVLRFDKNCGKGQAIRAAVDDCVERGFTHLLTVDGDGQHLIRETKPLTDLARDNPWDLIIGQRRMEAVTVPSSSRFGRAFSNFWVQYQTGLRVKDSQSGCRVYPLFHLQRMKFLTSRYEFEIEVLIRLLWKGVGVREAEIDVLYPPGDQRVSHFRKWTDNVRISLLNTVLVIVSMLRSHRAPAEVALALGLGVMIGCTPLYGLHTLLALGIAFVFRLNAVYLVLGSNISIPPLAPFLVTASLALGSWLLSGDARAAFAVGDAVTGAGGGDLAALVAMATRSLKAWVVGSLMLGALLGSLSGALAYGISWRMQGLRAKRANWSGRTRGGALGNGFLKWVLRSFGLRAGYACLLFVVPYFYLFAPRARRALHEYWAIVQPTSSKFDRMVFTLRHLRKFGQVLMDRAFVASATTAAFHTVPHGMEHILAGMKSDRGVILLSGHVGGWDLATAALPQDGFNERIHVVRFEATGRRSDEVAPLSKHETVARVASNQAGSAIFQVHELLSTGQAVGLMGDRPLSARYELLQFMGFLAPFDVTPFRIAAATRSAVVVSFGFKGEGNVYEFYAEPAKQYVYDPAIDRAVICRQWAQEFAATLEHHIRRYPTQWFNFFPFWSSLPTNPQGDVSARSRNQLEAYSAGALGTLPNPASALEAGPTSTAAG